MKKLISIFLFCYLPFLLFSQDTLLLLNGRKIYAKVQSIEDSIIKYSFSEKKFAQEQRFNNCLRSWSIGADFGVMLPYSEIRNYGSYPFFGYTDARRPALNFEINKSFFSLFALQGYYSTGRLYGEIDRAFKTKFFNAELYDYGVNLVLNLNRIALGKSYNDDCRLQVFAKAGMGTMKFRSVLKWKGEPDVFINSYGYKNLDTLFDTRVTAKVYPLGLGVKYRLGSNLQIKLETSIKITDTDKLDANDVNSKNDRYGMTTLGLVFKPGRSTVSQIKSIDRTDVYAVKYHNGKNVFTFVDTLNNRDIIGKVGDYLLGAEFARRNFKPTIATAGSFVAGAMGGYIPFYGIVIPTGFIIGLSSMEPDIYNIDGKLMIPKDKEMNEYFIQGYKDKVRRMEVKNTLYSGLAGMAVMILVRSLHLSMN